MFRNRIYKVFYRSPLDDFGFSDHALAVLRDGQIMGSDRLGAVFTGEPGFATAGGNAVTIDLTVPPGGELISGFKAGPSGASVTINTDFDPSQDTQVKMVDIGGGPVEVQLVYLGPLPE